MPRLSKDHAHALSELRTIAARSLPPDRMGSALLSILERAIGWDGYRLFGLDTRTLLINRLISASDNDRAARREWLEEVYLDDRTLPYLRLPEIARARLRAVAYQPTQDQSWGYPDSMLARVDPKEHRTYYFESQSPIGGTLHATFEATGRQIAVLQAYRRDPKTTFRQKDVSLMQTASPIIGQALGVSLARERALAEWGTAVPSGIVLVGPNHSIDFSTPAGDDWLDQLRATEPEATSPLPAVVWSAVKGLSQQGQPALRLFTMTPGGPVVLEASAGGNGATAIVVSPHRPDARLEPPEHWGLTPQQSQIVMGIIGGASNRELAERLFLAENTVEWHLRQIYRSLDLASRTQLQARFFRDAGIAVYHEPSLE